jgi:competence protein ComEC
MPKFSRDSLLLVVLLLLICSTIFIWQIIYSIQDSQDLKVTFLDVGQGDAIYIESPSGVQVLVDGGSSGPLVLRRLGSVMPFYDRSINMVVATHPDTDHIGGLIDVLKRYKVDRILRPGVWHDAPAINSLLLEITKEQDPGAIETLARRGQVYDLGLGEAGRVELHILYPDRDVSNVETNTASIVARLTYGDSSVLLTGDSPKAIEKYLVSLDAEGLQSDILKLGHHGSKTSSAISFLGFVRPQWAVVSAGADNRYGHPHKEVLERLEQLGMSTKNTANIGSITFVSNGRQWRLD